jgi:DNA-binding PadR family transcriptional regulator
MAGKTHRCTELAVFKGRKANLTHAILQILSNKALVKYDVHKAILNKGFKDTRYGTVKEKIKLLEETGYLKQSGARKTQPGTEGILYEVTFKALAALKLHATDLEEVFKNMNEETALELLALLTRIQSTKSLG